MLSEFLRKYRLENGMTQVKLAEKLSISQNAVSQYEAGKRMPTVKRLTGIASLLNCSVSDIVPDSDTSERGA